ncbi:MAG: prepilin-type N-terminal cleavage/methylation domain-containing protein, partial [Alphaproteobacteria bacterium]|nr:prepilin-type N-terminal cleavage/methylation domain-containing protein [Alphaproteobacteria bacterium]
PMTPRRHNGTLRPPAGFTLLELLVALLLLGMISTMALGGVRLGARTWETVTAKAGANGRMQTVRAFLARELAQAVPVRVTDRGGETRLAYEGDRESLVFVAPLAPHFGLGGFQRLELFIADNDPIAGKQLILNRRLFHRDDALDAAAEEDDEIHLLLDGIEEAEFAYREGGRDGGAWSSDWRDRDELPALVRLRVTFRGGRKAVWPDLLVARRITTQPGCLPAEAGAGCRNR